MITSNLETTYIWVWLPQQKEPIVCGRLWREKQYHLFAYGQSYLHHNNAIALDPIELPLQPGAQRSDADIHRAIRDAAPDAWGRRVILYQQQLPITALDEGQFSEINFLRQSNSNRIGALHVQTSADFYQPSEAPAATLEELMQAAEKIEAGQPLPADLNAALLHGTSIGGARPKAFLNGAQNSHQYIAKFSSNTDFFPIVKAEFAAMQLAKQVGIIVAPTEIHRILEKDILLVERFDRGKINHNQLTRQFMISGLTALQLHEMEARYASYLNLADFIRRFCKDPARDLLELYHRMIFNILIGNTDDHARNHAFFWDGHYYQLTPAYDICPLLRTGHIATQAMQVGQFGAQSTLANALSGCERFDLTKSQAQQIHVELVEKMRLYWPKMCELAQLGLQDRANLAQATVLSDYCFEG